MNSASEKFYDRLTGFYPVIDFFIKPQKRKFFNMINCYPSGKVLEIGVGNGSHLKYYKTHEITGIDTSDGMLDRARRYQRDNIQVAKMNAEELSFPDETFDYIILSHVIAVVENPEKVLEEAYRVLKPHGKVFILNHFTPDNGLKYLDRLMSGISTLFHFKSVFNINSVRSIERFKLLGSFAAGSSSYFKILIYEKKV
jgi:phosphatidylethanolamine/phosphatidyl-N-methylethanolamine N-methyltransferase